MTIFSAQQLPKPKGQQKGEIIDPYVKVEVYGVPDDTTKAQTSVVRNNGFNPVWAGQVRTTTTTTTTTPPPPPPTVSLTMDHRHQNMALGNEGKWPSDYRTVNIILTPHVMVLPRFSFPQALRFPLKAPEYALISFGVWDRDTASQDDFVASIVLPATTLREGYRHVPLNSFNGSRAADFEHASLLIHVAIQPWTP